jgi:hypothetical protein
MTRDVVVPVVVTKVACSCGAIFDYRYCDPGFYGFETYLGLKSRSMYRLDPGSIGYQGKDREELLRAARQAEGQLLRAPEELTCEQCGCPVTSSATRELGPASEVTERVTVIE